MSNFTDRNQFASNGTFRAQVRAALILAAVNIASEDTGTDFHKPRRAFASQVLRSPDSYTAQFATTAAMQPGVKIDGTATDDDVQFTVNSLWNAFAVTDDSNPQGLSSAPVSTKLTPA